MSYRINPLADAWRLLRGTFAASLADPYIQQNPRALSHRKDLFQWSSIDTMETSGVFATYSPYRSVEPVLMQHLPTDAGRRAYEHLMILRESRLVEIDSLLSRHGVTVEASEDSWRAIASFLHQYITPSAETEAALVSNPPVAPSEWLQLRGEHFISPLWQSVVVDLALLMGEHVMHAQPSTTWCFWADSGFDGPDAYGRSPWLLDRDRSGEKPHRSLVFERIGNNAHNALEASLKGDDVDGAVPLGDLFTSLVSAD